MTNEITNEELARLKALAEAATPGPWDHDEELTPWRIDGGEVVGGDGTGRSVVYTDYDWHVKVGEESDTGSAIYESTGEPATIVEHVRKVDAAFMAAANPATILALIAKVESLAADAERLDFMMRMGFTSAGRYSGMVQVVWMDDILDRHLTNGKDIRDALDKCISMAKEKA